MTKLSEVYTGAVFGKLTVISCDKLSTTNPYVECKCVCGSSRNYNYHKLGTRANSCGCSREGRRSNSALPIGAKYGRWNVVGIADSLNGKLRMKVICDCGTVSEVDKYALTYGTSKSCGCLHAENMRKLSSTHGKSKTAIYRVYRSMLNRCSSMNLHNSHRYVGRGITVCEAWLNSFENFYADMGDRPTAKHQLDRLDNSLGYYKENCRWVSPQENARNRDNSIAVEVDGEHITLKDLAIKLGIKYGTLYYRYTKGYRGSDLYKST